MIRFIIERFSNYDITIDEDSKAMSYINRKDEIGRISNALLVMNKNLVNLVKDISDSAQQVASSSEELTAISQQSATVGDEIANASEVLAQLTNEMQEIVLKSIY